MFLTYGVVLLIYFCCPKYAKFIIFVVNLFVPDPLPGLDEIIMAAGLFLTDRN